MSFCIAIVFHEVVMENKSFFNFRSLEYIDFIGLRSCWDVAEGEDQFSYSQQEKSFRYNLIFNWKLFEWIRDRFERTIGDFALWMKPPIKAEAVINIPGRLLSFLFVVAESED